MLQVQYRRAREKTNLWCKVEAQVAAAGEVVLDQERHLAGEADLDLGRQGSGLAEVDQVLEGKGQRHGLCQLDVDIVLGLFNGGVASQSDGAITNVTVAGEFDTILGSLNANYQQDSILASALFNKYAHTFSQVIGAEALFLFHT